MFARIKASFHCKALSGGLLLLFSLHLLAQTGPLPRSSPEREGVPAQAIGDFIQAIGKHNNEFHSFMFVRHGKVIAEGWWNPYAADLKHTLYSTSKSFTAAAVGFALTEKRLKLTDKVISFFPPEEVPDTVSPNLAALTVQDALIMSDGQDPDPSGKVGSSQDWAKTFLATAIINKPGTKFLYNSAGTYMLSAIVQRVTGQRVIDYLRPRLFEPLGITGEDWETSPQGVNTGGWGLRLKTEDMAKFGLLYLNGGRWNGKQIIPKEWVRDATTAHIMQDPDAPQGKKDSSDWLQGYCYQMWRCRNNGVRADGAFGQYIIMLPEKDAVIAITSETADMQDELNLVWQYLLPAMGSKPLKEDREADLNLQRTLAALALPLPLPQGVDMAAANSGAFAASGKTYALQPNAGKMKAIGFRALEGGSWQVNIKGDTADYSFTFGKDKWTKTLTTRPGPNLTSFAVHHFVGIPPVMTAGSFYWKDQNTLVLVLRYIESPHTETFTCHFQGSEISIDHERSFDFGKQKTVITGTLRE